MLELLIPSKTRIRLLTLFLMNPGRAYYIREIERMTGEHYAAVYKELGNLASFGILSGEHKGKQMYYSVNQGHFLYHELQQIVLKTEGVVKSLREQLQNLQGISCLFIYGSYAAGTADKESDIDLFIVGDVEEGEIITAVHTAEKILQREINYTLMSEIEYRKRQKDQDPFVKNVLQEPRIIIEGCHD